MNLSRFLPFIEKCFVIFGLTFFSGAFSIGANEAMREPGLIPESMITLVRYTIWLISSVAVIAQWKRALWFLGRDPWLWLLQIIVILSGLWSVDADLTNTAMREIFQMTTFGLYMALRFDFRQQVQLIAMTFGIGGLLSTVLAVGMPGVGKHLADHPGAWKGLYDYKNTFGSMMVLGSLAFFLLPKEDSKLFRWGGFCFMLIMMLMSTSKTSLILSLVLVSILAFYRKFRWKGKATVVFMDLFVLIGGCFVFLFTQNWVALVTGLGKDPSISGRTPIWTTSINYLLEEHPLLGYGRGAFWSLKLHYGASVGSVVAQGFVVPHGHNGFLDLTLDTGMVGLCLFFVSYAIAYVRSLKQAYASDDSENYWGIAYLTFLAMNNLTESYLLRTGSLYWSLYITTVLSVMVGYKPREASPPVLLKDVDPPFSPS
jgi:exopolysaccharide production protein ExoQ